MAIATNGGHVARAIDFYNSDGMYFIIGGTEPWTVTEGGVTTESSAPPADTADTKEIFKLNGVVGLKKVDKKRYVKVYTGSSENREIITFKDSKYKVVEEYISTTTKLDIAVGDTVIKVDNTLSFRVEDRVRINNTYEGIITSINFSDSTITLDTPAPSIVGTNSLVEGGAVVEDANYVYVECSLEYDRFPIVDYRQVGLCTRVSAREGVVDDNILVSADYNDNGLNDYKSLGILEIIDNRVKSTRSVAQTDVLSLIVQF